MPPYPSEVHARIYLYLWDTSASDTQPLLLEMILADLLATEWVADTSYETKRNS